MAKKLITASAVILLVILSLYQDIIGKTTLQLFGQPNAEYSPSLFVGHLAIIPIFLFAFGSYKKINFQKFASTINLKTCLLFLVLPLMILKILPLVGLYIISSTFLLNRGIIFSLQESWTSFLLFSINTIFLGPVIEELLFRGVIFDRLSKFIPVIFAAILSSLAFSLLHYEDAQVIFAFITGMILAIIYRKTQNLAYPIILHIALNAVTVLTKLVSF